MSTFKKVVSVLVSITFISGLAFAEMSSKAKKAEKLAGSGKIEEALEIYRELMEKDPQKNPELIKEGRAGVASCLVIKLKGLYDGKKYGEAKTAADNIIREYKETPSVKEAAKYLVSSQIELSRALVEAKKYDQCVTQSKAVLDKTPEGTEGIEELGGILGGALYAQGRNALDDGDFANAISKFESVVKDYSQTDKLEQSREDLSEAYLKLGALFTQQKNYIEAIGVFDKLMAGFSDAPEVILEAKKGMAKVLLAQADEDIVAKKYEDAIKNLNSALGVSTEKQGEAQCKYALGMCLGKVHQHEKAITEYKDVIANYPGTDYVSASYADLYAVYLELDYKEQALDNIEHAVQSAPGNSDYLFKQMQLQYDLNKTQEAQSSAQKLLDILPQEIAKTYTNRETLQFRMGQSYLVLGKFTEAIVEFEKALSRNPDMLETKKSLAFAMFNDKDYKDALGIYESLIKYYSAGFNALGDASAKQGDTDLEKRKENMLKDIAYFHFREGLCYEQLAQYDKALAECKKGLEGVSTQEAAEAIKRIDAKAAQKSEPAQ